jgi:hypothetical protein
MLVIFHILEADSYSLLSWKQISHEWVTRLLINNNRIERLVLAEDRQAAERILRDHPKYMVWTCDLLRVQRFRY